MMKFLVKECSSSRSRVGKLIFDDFKSTWNGSNEQGTATLLSKEYETPLCLQYTQTGTIPHVSWHLTQHLQDDKVPALITLPFTFEMKESLKAFNSKSAANQVGGLANFVGMDDRPCLVIIQDPLVPIRKGHNTRENIAVFSARGKLSFGPKSYFETIKHYRPNAYQVLCDSETTPDSGSKRVKNSVDRSLEFLDTTIELQSKEQDVAKTSMLGTIEGGYNTKMRIFSAKETALRPVDGFIIDGFHLYGSKLETEFEIELVKPILMDTVQYLPPEKPRMMLGVFKPETILYLVNEGIDVFDSSYVTMITEKGFALQSILNINDLVFNKNYILDLNTKEFKEVFEPIQRGCDCYTCCQKFSKSYVNHLLNTTEMLAQVLLMFHNLHVFYQFFRDIKKLIQNDQLNKIIKQL